MDKINPGQVSLDYSMSMDQSFKNESMSSIQKFDANSFTD